MTSSIKHPTPGTPSPGQVASKVRSKIIRTVNMNISTNKGTEKRPRTPTKTVRFSENVATAKPLNPLKSRTPVTPVLTKPVVTKKTSPTTPTKLAPAPEKQAPATTNTKATTPPNSTAKKRGKGKVFLDMLDIASSPATPFGLGGGVPIARDITKTAKRKLFPQKSTKLVNTPNTTEKTTARALLETILGPNTVDPEGYVSSEKNLSEKELTKTVFPKFFENIQGSGKGVPQCVPKDAQGYKASCKMDFLRLQYAFKNEKGEITYISSQERDAIESDNSDHDKEARKDELVAKIWKNVQNTVRDAADTSETSLEGTGSSTGLKSANFALSALMDQGIPILLSLYLHNGDFAPTTNKLNWTKTPGGVLEGNTEFKIFSQSGEERMKKGQMGNTVLTLSPGQKEGELSLEITLPELFNTATDASGNTQDIMPKDDQALKRTFNLSLSLSIKGAEVIGQKLMSGEKISPDDISALITEGSCVSHVTGKVRV